MKQVQIAKGLTRKVWQQLEKSIVPIVSQDHLIKLDAEIDDLNFKIRNNSYMPGTGHGYLGVEKRLGVTRFLPILSRDDLAVYYQLCGELGDLVLIEREDIYGGWQVVPQPKSTNDLGRSSRNEVIAARYQQGYFQDTLSNAAWFQGFRDFTQLITTLINDKEGYGNFVATTDVANFYDSIDVGRLISKLREKLPEHTGHLELLQVFLSFWNRRSTGYQASTKGLPQEIISDGSRNLSHFYLQDFDDRFSTYCSGENLRYVRWADDLLVFGPSPQKLETAMHQASRLLLIEGLNLSAPKTKIMGKRQFSNYRGLDVLDAINSKEIDEYRKSRQAAMRRHRSGEGVKLDTIFRASLGFLSQRSHIVTFSDQQFLWNTVTDNPDLLGSMNAQQCLSFVRLTAPPSRGFAKLLNTALLKDVAGPKAVFLSLIKHHSMRLEKIGVTKAAQRSAIDEIVRASADSELILKWCVPPARLAVG
ncbi:RNA-directed DNA polymerase [Tritonibacter mobilis]|uniref:RNA-directed DNA polymerase n=1 Tax=Tritonibacter mobilis TaxID=379347 RepID=UPI001C090D69|nr:RNA-directed DNA polymerase [Tritonibacter mobilis]MBU3034251.1 RNA-directed DNA polymerase [Tritonibacter mobilis]WHQ84310.1 RNA-directed DNA polymerase [Tritonibacter mobilis]